MAKNQRSIKNIIVNKPLQIRIAYYFILLSSGLLGLMVVFLNIRVNAIRSILETTENIPEHVQLGIDDALAQIMIATVSYLIISLIVTLFYSVFISHRIAGPMHAILQYIGELKAGNFSYSRKLRPGDELAPIMDALHDLAGDLNKK